MVAVAKGNSTVSGSLISKTGTAAGASTNYPGPFDFTNDNGQFFSGNPSNFTGGYMELATINPRKDVSSAVPGSVYSFVIPSGSGNFFAYLNGIQSSSSTVSSVLDAGNRLRMGQRNDLSNSGSFWTPELVLFEGPISTENRQLAENNSRIQYKINLAQLSNLSSSSGSFTASFVPTDTVYSLSVSNAQSSITLTPVAQIPGSRIQYRVNSGSYSDVSSGSATPSIALSIGNTSVDFLVTSTDGTRNRLYSVTVNRKQAFYSTGSGNLHSLSSWNSSRSGNGSAPSVINSGADWIIQSGHTLTVSSALGFGAIGGKLELESGALLQINQGLTLAAGFTLSVLSGAQVEVNTNCTLNHLDLAGKIKIGDNTTLTLAGPIGIASGSISGGLLSNLTVAAALGTLNFDQSTPGTSNVLRMLTIGTGAEASLTLGNALELAPTGSLNFNPSGNKAFSTGGQNFVLRSSAAGTAGITNLHGATVTGNVTVQRFVPGGKRAFRFFSHPFSTPVPLSALMDDIHITGPGGQTNGFDSTFTNNASAFLFEESAFTGVKNSGYSGFTSTSQTIDPRTPIRLLVRGPRTQPGVLTNSATVPDEVTLDWSGPINQGNVSYTMDYTSSLGVNAGWNLIPNPYPCAIDIGSIVGQSRGNVNNFGVWLPNNATRGGFSTVTFGNPFIIPSGGAFFIKVSSGFSFQFTEAMKLLQAPSAILHKSDPLKQQALQLNLVSDDTIFWDQFVLRNRENSLDALDNLDGEKMENPDVNFGSLVSSNELLAIDYRPLSNATAVKLMVTSTSSYHFTFKLDNMDLPDHKVFLKDKFLNVQEEILPGFRYNFSIDMKDSNTFGHNRFELVFAKRTTGINSLSKSSAIWAYPNPVRDKLTLATDNGFNGSYQVRVFDQSGKTLIQSDLRSTPMGELELQVEHLAAGAYLLELKNNDLVFKLKFIK